MVRNILPLELNYFIGVWDIFEYFKTELINMNPFNFDFSLPRKDRFVDPETRFSQSTILDGAGGKVQFSLVDWGQTRRVQAAVKWFICFDYDTGVATKFQI